MSHSAAESEVFEFSRKCVGEASNQVVTHFDSAFEQPFSATVLDQVSRQITRSYQEIEHQVSILHRELLDSDQARLKAHFAREMLEQRLDVIVQAMPVAVILLDGLGEVSQANSIAEELLGMALAGRRWIDIIQECISPKPADGHEIYLNNGRLVSIATQSLANEPGQVIVLTDHTETRNLQSKINHNRKLSEMGKMTASLAHQIRTPLATATLYADHLAAPELSDERRLNYAGKLKDRLIQLEQQVSDMLIFSKSGIALKDTISSRDIAEILQQKAHDLGLIKKVAIKFIDSTPNVKLRVNIDLLASVFSNLMDNSLQACADAKIETQIIIKLKLCSDRFMSIQVQDNGPGIADGVSSQIMEPFFTTKSSGTGLGLAVAKAVIEAHGGHFTLNNNETSGACANISLPLYVAEK